MATSSAYGYLRLPESIADATVQRLEIGLLAAADRRGLTYRGVIHEFDAGSFRNWFELVEELRRTGARHVFVPSQDHLARNAILRNSLARLLHQQTGACIHSASKS